MDVHTATISVAVRDAAGKLIMESVIETKTSTILQFIQGLRGDLHVTFEEGTWAAWLYDLLKPYVTNVVVCNPRRNALLKEGSRNDRIDARKLAELLRTNLLRSIPALGPIRAAVLMAIVQTPHRFRTKRLLWKYSGFGVVTHSSADHRYVKGQLERSKKPVSVRGLDRDHNHQLKDLFKGAAIQASTRKGPFREFYEALVAKGMRPEMARLTLARKIAVIALTVWKKGGAFDAKYLKPQTA